MVGSLLNEILAPGNLDLNGEELLYGHRNSASKRSPYSKVLINILFGTFGNYDHNNLSRIDCEDP